MHVVNDGLFAGTYPLLPLVAAELGLSYAQVGAIKTALTGASSILQVPAGILAERMGEQLLLALGTAWLAAGLLGTAFAAGYVSLLALCLVAGLGGNVQHPVASAVVSRLFDSGRRATAIGTLNFAGDVGKVIAPIVVGVAAAAGGWRAGFAALGIIGLVFSLLYVAAVPEPNRAAPASGAGHATADGAEGVAGGRGARADTADTADTAGAAATAAGVTGWGIRSPRLFTVLLGIGVLDSAARGTALVLIPFLLEDKGAEPASMSFYFSAIFAAGAAGKFICGPLADRFGNVGVIAITELVTAGALAGLLAAPLGWALAALLPLGFVLNGTSSVLYALVATLTDARRRARTFGLYYTCSLLGTAVAPVAYGVVADRAGLGAAFLALAVATAAIVPVVLTVGKGLAEGGE